MTPPNSSVSILLTVAVIGVLVLLWGSWRIWRGGDRKKAALMFVVAVVLVANILIQTL